MAKSFSVEIGDFVEVLSGKMKGEILDVVDRHSSEILDDGFVLTVRNNNGQTIQIPEVWVKVLATAKEYTK